MMTPRSWAVIWLALSLAGCGFKLRGQISELPFEHVYVTAPAGQTIGSDLERAISTHTRARVEKKVERSDATIQIAYAIREKRILSLAENGRVREFELIYRVAARLLGKQNTELAALQEIRLSRTLPFLDAQELAKAAEEEMLYKDMQKDAVQQILRQVAAVKPKQSM